MKKKVLIVGGKGSGQIAMSIFEDSNIISNEWDIEGYLTDILNPGQKLGKHKVIGSTKEVLDYVNKGFYIHNTLYFNAKDKKNRVNRFKKLNIPKEANASCIHPTAIITPDVKIGEGVLINQYALLQVGCDIKNYVHIYSNALVGHDSIVKDYCTIGAHSIIGGRALLSEGVHTGLNCSIREDIKIGQYAIVGMGSVVINDISAFNIVAGNPAKIINRAG